MEAIGKFIGPKKIKEIVGSSRKTYLGRDVVEITYEDDTKEEFPLEVAAQVITQEPTDFTALEDAIAKPLLEKMTVILLEAEIKIIYIERILHALTGHLNQKIDTAIDKAIGKDKYTRTLADINTVLTTQHGRNKTKNIKH